MTHAAPSVDQPLHRARPAVHKTRADVHIRMPRELLSALDARLDLMPLRPARTAAIVDAITRWVAWDERRASAAPNPSMGAPKKPPKADDGPRDPTYHPLDHIP
jgi:hypothetical protein